MRQFFGVYPSDHLPSDLIIQPAGKYRKIIDTDFPISGNRIT